MCTNEGEEEREERGQREGRRGKEEEGGNGSFEGKREKKLEKGNVKLRVGLGKGRENGWLGRTGGNGSKRRDR